MFPENPVNGTIYEIIPGIFYKYDAPSMSWNKINKSELPLATPVSNGLMSSEDFLKIMGIQLPSLDISISSEDCDTTYDDGEFTFTEGDDYINIDDPEKIHEDTAGVNFTIDMQNLSDYLQRIGKLNILDNKGDKGETGDSGDDGMSLAVGPYGPNGEDGRNSAWDGQLIQSNYRSKETNKGIVDINIEKVNDRENYLVVDKAVIGDPDACADQINIKSVNSPWLLAYDSDNNVVTTNLTREEVRRQQEECPDCEPVCQDSSCQSLLYYFNVGFIIDSIKNQLQAILTTKKTEYENMVNAWLQRLQNVFDIQKAALCCALEACRSRSRNEDLRRYVQDSMMNAALGGYKIKLGGNKIYSPDDNWPFADANKNWLDIDSIICEDEGSDGL